MKWLLPFAFLAAGLEAGTVDAGYAVRLVEGFVFVKSDPAAATRYEANLGQLFPAEVPCFTREGSKLELIGPSITLRFGEATNFVFRADGKLELHQGSLLIYSRRPDVRMQVEGPSGSMMVSGEGVAMLEVTTNGGFKIVGLVGAMRLEENGREAAGSSLQLGPGELVFMKPLGNGFGDKLNVRLSRIYATSRLVSGYGNTARLRDHLLAAVEGQTSRIVRSFGLTVGDAPELNHFQTFPLTTP